jgi:hypothetical protein
MVKEVPKYGLDDIVELKKAHPCTSRSKNFKIVRIGADIKFTCLGCGNTMMLSRDLFNQRIKKTLPKP